MTAYKYRMPHGIPGDVSRHSLSTIVAKILGATAFTAYAQFAKVSSNTMVPIDAADSAASIVSVLIRPFPTQGPNASDPLSTSVPTTPAAFLVKSKDRSPQGLSTKYRKRGIPVPLPWRVAACGTRRAMASSTYVTPSSSAPVACSCDQAGSDREGQRLARCPLDQ